MPHCFMVEVCILQDHVQIVHIRVINEGGGRCYGKLPHLAYISCITFNNYTSPVLYHTVFVFVSIVMFSVQVVPAELVLPRNGEVRIWQHHVHVVALCIIYSRYATSVC